MKYLKYLQTTSDFESFKNSEDYILPNVSYVVETEGVSFEPYVPPILAGNIVYKSNSKLNTINYEEWNSSLGTPVGVVVVPPGFAPDGKTRILSLNWASASTMKWSNTEVDTSIVNNNRVPITDNAGSTTTGSNSYGYLPSDKFTGVISYVDSTAKYHSTSYTPFIPSPYLEDKPNPVYYAAISGYNNVLADFDGKGNTDVLVGLGTGYTAANAARNYKAAGAEEIEWYLPSTGELGFLVARCKAINAAITTVGGDSIASPNCWSSSESLSGYAYYVSAHSGGVSETNKSVTCSVRPFAIID